MSWLYSRVLVEEYSGANSLDGEPSAPSSGNPTPQAYCAPDKTTVFSRLSRFGMTFKPLTEDRGEALLMSYLAAFPARTSQSPEKGPESTESAAECGNTWRGWLAKYDQDSSSWRTAQCSFIEDLPESLETLPRSGMTRGGLLWELPTLELRTKETGSGLWPTPLATDGSKCPSGSLARAVNPALQATFRNKVEGRNWPTPAARDYRHPNAKSYAERGGGSKGEQLPNAVGGALNPTWVEWLMGWPLGWTDLKPLEMDKSHSAPQQPGDI
jgi:hypothetical protein